MKKITTKGPMSLKGLEFNIPLFNAEAQMYLCDEVKETTHGSYLDHKKYTLSFSWIPSSYSVPEKVEMELNIPDNVNDKVMITMHEINRDGKKYNITKNSVLKEKLGSLSSLREIFKLSAQSM